MLHFGDDVKLTWERVALAVGGLFMALLIWNATQALERLERAVQANIRQDRQVETIWFVLTSHGIEPPKPIPTEVDDEGD